MGLEDKHLDVLQNIEFVISKIYENDDSLTDVQVIKSLEALQQYYRALATGKTPKTPDHLNNLEMETFDLVVKILEMRKKGAGANKEENEKCQRETRHLQRHRVAPRRGRNGNAFGPYRTGV